MPIDFSSPHPVYLQIADDLWEQIEQGRYEPGEQLPARKQMAADYGVAPETLKKALDELRSKGVLETRSTRGTFVLKKPAKREPLPDLHDQAKLLEELRQRMDDFETQLDALRRELSAPQAAPSGDQGDQKDR